MNGIRRFCLVLFVAILFVSHAEARLGFTLAEWGSKFGKPDAQGVYRWEGNVGRVRGGPFLLMIRTEEGRVTGIQLRKESGHLILNSHSMYLINELRCVGEYEVSGRDALSEDRKTLTLVMPKAPEPDPKASILMGKYTNDWIKALGKPDDDGYYRSGEYRLQPATNKNSGKVDWIRVLKVSGGAFTEEEAGRVYESLTGRKREDVPNPPSLHKEDTMLLMTKPKRQK